MTTPARESHGAADACTEPRAGYLEPSSDGRDDEASPCTPRRPRRSVTRGSPADRATCATASRTPTSASARFVRRRGHCTAPPRGGIRAVADTLRRACSGGCRAVRDSHRCRWASRPGEAAGSRAPFENEKGCVRRRGSAAPAAYSGPGPGTSCAVSTTTCHRVPNESSGSLKSSGSQCAFAIRKKLRSWMRSPRRLGL